jgi:hypothetical protein
MSQTIRYDCPYPGCRWNQTYLWPNPTPNKTELDLRVHLDEGHPGWTMEEVTAHADRIKRQAEIKRVFGAGPNDMFKHN